MFLWSSNDAISWKRYFSISKGLHLKEAGFVIEHKKHMFRKRHPCDMCKFGRSRTPLASSRRKTYSPRTRSSPFRTLRLSSG
jgi:hypothetical protein